MKTPLILPPSLLVATVAFAAACGPAAGEKPAASPSTSASAAHHAAAPTAPGAKSPQAAPRQHLRPLPAHLFM